MPYPVTNVSGPEPGLAEAVDDGVESPRPDRLRTVERDPQRRQVEASEVVVGDPPGDQLVGEVRRHGELRLVAVDHVQPPDRALEERQRRHEDEVGARVDRQ